MKLLPSCREVRDHLTEYAEGTLTRRERASLWLHLLLCTACFAFYQGLRRLPGVARALLGAQGAPPEEAAEALRAALRRIAGRKE
jgi:predicted anti-sigma-YlaC factor YlaD